MKRFLLSIPIMLLIFLVCRVSVYADFQDGAFSGPPNILTGDLEVGTYSIDGDSSAGLAFDPDNDGTDEITMNANGTMSVTGTSDNYFAGKVGIGTTAPDTGLDVEVTSNIAALSLFRVGGTNTGLTIGASTSSWAIVNSGGDFLINEDGYCGTERLIIDNGTGNVGIGNTAPTYLLDATEIGNSDGGFKIQPDVEGDVTLFEDTDVANDADGKSLYVHRKAAEGDGYVEFHVSKSQSPSINMNGLGKNHSIFAESNELNIRADEGNGLIKLLASDVQIGQYGAANPTFKQDGTITAIGGRKYIQYQVNDTTDNYELTREDSNIGAFDIQMPLTINSAYTLPTVDGSADELLSTDGAGTVSWSANVQSYGEMYTVDNAAATTITAVSEWHAVSGATVSAGYNQGFTFDAGSSGDVTGTSDGGGGLLVFADADHGLSIGDIVTTNNFTNAVYNDIFEVQTVPSAGTFTVTAAYTASETGSWQQGASLTADVGTSGIFRGLWAASGTSETNAQFFDFTPCLNTAVASKAKARRRFSNTDYGSFSGTALMEISAGDIISFVVQNTTGAGDITIRTRDMNLIEID